MRGGRREDGVVVDGVGVKGHNHVDRVQPFAWCKEVVLCGGGWGSPTPSQHKRERWVGERSGYLCRCSLDVRSFFSSFFPLPPFPLLDHPPHMDSLVQQFSYFTHVQVHLLKSLFLLPFQLSNSTTSSLCKNASFPSHRTAKPFRITPFRAALAMASR